jgi:hypothetical protein
LVDSRSVFHRVLAVANLDLLQSESQAGIVDGDRHFDVKDGNSSEWEMAPNAIMCVIFTTSGSKDLCCTLAVLYPLIIRERA